MTIIRSEHGEQEHQHISGAVSPDGNPMWGEGFSVKQIRYGLYVVEFERPFVKEPAAVCTVFGDEWKTFNLSIAILEITPWYFVCTTSTPDRPIDCGFTFIAFGDL